MINVLVMSPCDEHDKKILETAGNDISFTYSSKSSCSLKEELAKAEIIVGEPEIEMIKESPNLKLIQMTMAGTDQYTRTDGFPSSITLCNASGAFGQVISQYVIGGILNICHKFYKYRDFQRDGIWEDAGSEINLLRKRVLIIGAGNIGSSVAEKLSVFGTENVGIRRNTSNIPKYFSEMYSLDELDSQLPLADIVVACIPNSDFTYHLFDKKKLLLMKKDAVLVNVGRGSFIVQDDLIEVLMSGHLSGAVLDVTEPEPLPKDSPLWYIDNVVITPHISGNSFGHSREITDTIYRISAQNIRNYADGKALKNVIDFSKFKK